MSYQLRVVLGGIAIVLGLGACGKKEEAPATANQPAAEGRF